jgi:small subunit ribosomal protein S3
MGHKVNPIGLRLGIIRTWDSRWYADDNYADLLQEDLRLRKYLKNRLKNAGVIIGKKGADIDKLKADVGKLVKGEVHLNIAEVRKPELDATLVAENIAQQLERRVAFRRAMKRAVQSAMRLGAEGIRITCSGRLGGAEIARTEWYREGRVPLHTLRADIDYGQATAFTTYGTCGVKVWVFKGEVLSRDPLAAEAERRETRASR